MNILITGGASGLGEAITRKLAEDKNNKIYFTYCSSESKSKSIEKELNNTHCIKCNFKSESELNTLINKINSLDLDALINNAYAGAFTGTYFHKTDLPDFNNEFNSNVFPTLAITQAAITSFRKKKNGRIITILSSALVGNPVIGASVYLANKAYLQQMTKVWASENAKYNIVSNSISPSFMKTNINKDIDERIIEQLIENHPLKKLLTPQEVAESVNFLIQAPLHINGTDILLNGAINIK